MKSRHLLSRFSATRFVPGSGGEGACSAGFHAGQARQDVGEVFADADRAREIALILKPVKLPRLPVLFNFFATAFWPPSRMIEILRVWWTLGDESHRFLERTESGAQVLICGHFHRAGIWEKNGRIVVDTGSFMQGSQPFLVDLEGDEMWVRKVEFSSGAFRPGVIEGFWEPWGVMVWGSEVFGGGGAVLVFLGVKASGAGEGNAGAVAGEL